MTDSPRNDFVAKVTKSLLDLMVIGESRINRDVEVRILINPGDMPSFHECWDLFDRWSHQPVHWDWCRFEGVLYGQSVMSTDRIEKGRFDIIAA